MVLLVSTAGKGMSGSIPGSDRPGKMPSLSFLPGNYHRARRDLNCRTQKEGETGYIVYGDMLEHSGDSPGKLPLVLTAMWR